MLQEADLALVDTPAFQRLRRVRQLGFTDLVFPGAHHTRFEHCLGVLHLATLVADRLRDLPGVPSITEQDRRTFRAAALLHDIGHYPFSHAVEELEMAQVRDHEGLAVEQVLSPPVATILSEVWDVDPVQVAWMITGGEGGDDCSPGLRLLRPALDSGLDVDKLDYLVRDAKGANVPYGMVDVQRLIGALEVGDGARLAIGLKGVAALQALVFAKYLMFATVYWHHACRAAVVMLLRALQEALGEGALEPSELERADDASLVALLRSAEMPAATRHLGQRLLDRQLYKRALELGVGDPGFALLQDLWSKPSRRLAVEDRWAEALSAAPGSVLIDVPEPKAIGSGLLPVIEDGRLVAWDDASSLATTDLARFEGWARRIRVFAASPELAGAVHDRRDELLTDLPVPQTSG